MSFPALAVPGAAATADTPLDLPAPDRTALRRLVLACAVLHDVDLEPYGGGCVLRGGAPVEVSWRDIRRAVAGHDPERPVARLRVLQLLRGARLCADLSGDELAARSRPVGLPVDHALHPGLAWVGTRVLGGALDLGIGFLGVGADPDRVELVPAECLRAGGYDPGSWTSAAMALVEEMGAVAASRLPEATVLRPIGDCDVVTLLGSATFRAALAGIDPMGMQAVAVPMRRRGWLDLSRIDPAFVLAAASATAEQDRGFARPVLVTADEVTSPPHRGDPARMALADPAARQPGLRPVRWR